MRKFSLLLFVLFPIHILAQIPFSVHAGYTTDKNIIMGAGVYHKNWYYGLSAQIKCPNGTKGRHYSNISWNEFDDARRGSGNYYDVYEFDFAYFFMPNLCIGMGLGYADKIEYQNSYDNTEILGNYNITRHKGGKMSSKGFINYYFGDSKNGIGRWMLSAQYDVVTGIGLSAGYNFKF